LLPQIKEIGRTDLGLFRLVMASHWEHL
jgi:hypothetical protein